MASKGTATEDRSPVTIWRVSNADVLVAFLRAKKGAYFCDRCLSEGTGIKPLAQVNQLERPLEHAREYRRMKTNCSACSRDLRCIGYFG